MNEEAKILSRSELAGLAEAARTEGSRVVLCHGCFDIVHPGHVRYLQFAKSQGDILIVSVSADAVVAKGPSRPLIPQQHRAENLAALACVDFVVIEDYPTAEKVLEELRPDIYVKGKEYETSEDPRFLAERDFVESYGGSIVFSSGDVVYSSTELIGKLGGVTEGIRGPIEEFLARANTSTEALRRAIDEIADLRVLVVGDVILDRYVFSERVHVASEAPVLSVSPVEEKVFLGGAGVVAMALSRHGVSVEIVSAGDRAMMDPVLGSEIARGGLDLDLIEIAGRGFSEKVRYFVDGRQVFKVDRSQPAPIPSQSAKELVRSIRGRASSVDGIIVTDFGLGLFVHEVVEVLTEIAGDIPVYVDVSLGGLSNILAFRNPRLAVPSEAELRFALGDDSSGLSHLAARFMEQSGARFLAITMGRRGLLLFEPRGPNVDLGVAHLPAMVEGSRDDVGAGDVLLALAAAVDMKIKNPYVGVALGAVAAARHVVRVGNDPPGPREVREALENALSAAQG